YLAAQRVEEGLIEAVAVGRGEDETGAELAAPNRERAGHVVAVADKDDRSPGHVAEYFAHRQKIAHGLTGVIVVGKTVDHGAGCMACELIDRLLLENAQDDGVDIATDDAREIGNALARAEADFAALEKQARAARLRHGRLKTDARAQRRLLENQRHDLALKQWLFLMFGVRFLQLRRFLQCCV